MRRSLKVILSVVLVALGIAGAVACGVLLGRQGLDRAEKLVSIGVGLVSVLIAAAGLGLAWLTWRQTTQPPAPTPPVTAGGVGAAAVGGASSARIGTEVSGIAAAPAPPAVGGSGVHASGTGSVAVGGDSTAPISTKVTGSGNTTP
jgi:hypothetical protein